MSDERESEPPPEPPKRPRQPGPKLSAADRKALADQLRILRNLRR